jgi:hypothetical protein
VAFPVVPWSNPPSPPSLYVVLLISRDSKSHYQMGFGEEGFSSDFQGPFLVVANRIQCGDPRVC